MCSRLSLFALRAIGANLNINLSRNVQITCISKTFAHKYSTTIVSRPGYIMSDIKTAPHTNICQKYSSDANQSTVPVVTYEEVKDLPNHPEKFLIDVREPNELQETGIIPTAINIPRNKNHNLTELIFFCFIKIAYKKILFSDILFIIYSWRSKCGPKSKRTKVQIDLQTKQTELFG